MPLPPPESAAASAASAAASASAAEVRLLVPLTWTLADLLKKWTRSFTKRNWQQRVEDKMRWADEQ